MDYGDRIMFLSELIQTVHPHLTVWRVDISGHTITQLTGQGLNYYNELHDSGNIDRLLAVEDDRLPAYFTDPLGFTWVASIHR